MFSSILYSILSGNILRIIIETAAVLLLKWLKLRVYVYMRLFSAFDLNRSLDYDILDGIRWTIELLNVWTRSIELVFSSSHSHCSRIVSFHIVNNKKETTVFFSFTFSIFCGRQSHPSVSVNERVFLPRFKSKIKPVGLLIIKAEVQPIGKMRNIIVKLNWKCNCN